MNETFAYALALVGTLAVNVPFGFWRAGVRKFSPAWFVAVHAAVPIVVALRLVLGLPFRWAALPLFVGAYFAGQALGARVRQRRRPSGQSSRP